MTFVLRKYRFPALLSIFYFAACSVGVGQYNIVPDDVEREALLALYNSTDGANWTIGNRWTPDRIASYPDLNSNLYGVEIENGDIVSISLISVGLKGTLPAALNNLIALQYLVMPYNNTLNGALPDLGALTRLKTLNLAYADFTGTLPRWITNLVNLETLDLTSFPFTSTQLAGSLPDDISNLTNLQYLSLSYNDLSGAEAIPTSFSNLDNLIFLSITDCNLQRVSVTTGLSGLADLTYLELAGNPNFVTSEGAFPDVLYNLPSLQYLFLQRENFNKLPTSLKLLPSLSYLDISTCPIFSDRNILGAVVDTLRFCTHLKTLAINNCGIVGLPANFGTLSSENVYMIANALDPSQCAGFSEMPYLKVLYISANNLTDLPLNLENSTTLESLTASSNRLYPIPERLQNFINLKQLDLSYNEIRELPAWFGNGNMNSIETLLLYGNEIPLPLPDNFKKLTNLYYLNLGNNNLSGTIPEFFSGFNKMYSLDLSFNELISPIPDLSPLTSLSFLYLQHNEFTGEFPSYFSTSNSPKSYFNLSYNHFDAFTPITNQWAFISSLSIDNNKFEFSDILKQTTPLYSFNYQAQDSVDQALDINAIAGEVLELRASVDTATALHCKFQWFKYQNGVTSVITTPAPLEAAKLLKVVVSAGDDGASYFYEITNDTRPALTLTSRPRRLHIFDPVNCVGNPPGFVNFYTNKYPCGIGFEPSVQTSSVCSIQSYLWNFGDGTTSIHRNPVHVYSAAGSYDVSLRIRYLCGQCSRETVIHKAVEYSTGNGGEIDSLIQITTDKKKNVISSSAVTFSDVWPLTHDNDVVGNQNEYLNGTSGVWRNNASYVYNVPRAASSTVETSKDGVFDLEQFSWSGADYDLIPHWIKTNTMTLYSPYSYELENRDALGIYSAALYDYGGHLPSANGVNMKYSEMAFTSFEYLNGKATGNWIFGNEALPDSKTYSVLVAYKHMAIVNATLDDLSTLEKANVIASNLPPLSASGKIFIADNEVVCMQAYARNPKWTVVVFSQAPKVQFWQGTITVKSTYSPAATADIVNDLAHTGKSSLKIASEKIFTQDLLKLDSGKTYFLNAWVSVNNISLLTPKLADNLGIDLIVKNKGKQVVKTFSFQPGGKIIEGWQQVRGAFTCPVEHALIEIKFKPGSTGTAWYDDIRFHPEKGNMRSYVYSLNDYRLTAILDEENFASFFYYDAEGNLYLTKKETEEGIKTITENVSYQKEVISNDN